MILKRRVALNGIWLDEVDSRIVISSIEPGDGRESISAVDTAAGFGQRITGNRRQTLDIIIRFRILEHGRQTAGMQARAEALEKVNAWAAAGGYLTLNYKPDRRLRVILAQAPGEGSLWDYTKEFPLTFRAYNIPYWEQETVRSVTIGGSSASASGTAQIDGSAGAQVNTELANTSGMLINTASVTVGGKTMSFSGLNMGAGEALIIDHDEDGYVRIRIRAAGGGYRSALILRDAASADDFVVQPGPAAIQFSAQRACRLTASWRARFL